MTTCGSDRCYFVLGDNRPNSSDSRQGWLVPAGNILGWVDASKPTVTPTMSEQISWEEAVQLIRDCRVVFASQAHSRAVMLRLDDGTLSNTVEPELDLIFAEISAVKEKCGDIQLVTE